MSARNERLFNLLAENRLKEVVECSVKKAINDALGGNCYNSENVMDIEWQEGAVCFAFDHQWKIGDKIGDGNGGVRSVDVEVVKSMIGKPDFQLNTIKQGDYIEASELDTEHKYNDVVEVFGLFDYKPHKNHGGYAGMARYWRGVEVYNGELTNTNATDGRKITFNQLMAIGELKRLEIELDKSNSTEFPDSCEDAVNKPSHYQFFEGVEVIEIIASSMTREQFKGYCLGNRIKYRLRAGNKDKIEQEIAKSDKYVELYDEHKHLCKK